MQCNQKRARGTLSAQTVALANKAPKCKQQGFASELFDFSPDPIEVKFAGVSFYNCSTLIRVSGVDLLSFKAPEEPGTPVLLSGYFSDITGATTLKIVDNVWSAGEENWDVEVQGPRITFRRAPGDIALQILVAPPHSLVIESIDMEFEGYYLKGSEHTLAYSQDGISWSTLTAVSISDCNVGIAFE
jgi:hypothetical protein